MSKESTKIQSDAQPLFSRHKAYSVSEILAAGGTTAFANKLGKHPERLLQKLNNLPPDAFLTEDEFALAMETLNQSK